jgi:hypothetical protein
MINKIKIWWEKWKYNNLLDYEGKVLYEINKKREELFETNPKKYWIYVCMLYMRLTNICVIKYNVTNQIHFLNRAKYYDECSKASREEVENIYKNSLK